VVNNVQEYLDKFSGNPGISEEGLTKVEAEIGLTFPPDYRAFLRRMDGGEGPIGPEAYLSLWRAQDIRATNQSYNVAASAPGFLAVGSDGGGEAYGFDIRDRTWSVVRMPFVGMSWATAVPVGDSFVDFLRTLSAYRGA